MRRFPTGLWVVLGAGVLGGCDRDAGRRDPDTGWQWAPKIANDDFEEQARFTVDGRRGSDGTCIYHSEAVLKEGESHTERVVAMDTLRCRFLVARGQDAMSRKMSQESKQRKAEMDEQLRTGAQAGEPTTEGEGRPNF